MEKEEKLSDKIIKDLRFLFKYKDSIIFKNEIFINEESFLDCINLSKESFKSHNKKFLKKLVELTDINLEELKKELGISNYYNILLFLYDVNSALINLMGKNSASKNYITKLIKHKKKDALFSKLNKFKINEMLSLFSEIVCTSNLMAGRNQFIVSGDKYKFQYKKNGPFDLILNSKNRYFYFDVKRLQIEKPLTEFNEEIIEKKIKDKIENVCKKGIHIDRPLFLIIDCSEISVLEKLYENSNENKQYEVIWTLDKIYHLIKNFFEKNLDIMPELKKIGGVGIFAWSICIRRDKPNLILIFRHFPYTNLSSKYNLENQLLLEINNILYSELQKEHTKIFPKTSNFELLGEERF